jgi:hypothetical protein
MELQEGSQGESIGVGLAQALAASPLGTDAEHKYSLLLLRGSEAGRQTYERIRDTSLNPSDPRIAAILRHVDAVNALYRGESTGRPDRDLAPAYLTEARRQQLQRARNASAHG